MQTSNDTIGDFLTRVRNAIKSNHETVVVPMSKTVFAIAKILEKKGYLKNVEVVEKKPQSDFVLTLKYFEGEPAIRGLKRVSKPGRRIYSPIEKIPTTIEGLGVTIVSTSKGVLTKKEALEFNVGGEVLCQIW